MFFDEAKLYVKSGDGGDGMSHFRREAHVPRGGPDGGDGGKGGDVILVATPTINTLIAFSRKRHFVAENGRKGGSQRKTGHSGEDMRIEVPLGTIARDAATGEVIADLVQPGQEVVVVKSGRGGRANPHFKSSTNHSPRLAERDEPVVGRNDALQLRSIADVGTFAMPNSG